MNIPLLLHDGKQVPGILAGENSLFDIVQYWEEDELVAEATLTEDTLLRFEVHFGYPSLCLTLPEGCRRISSSACQSSHYLTRVILPGTLEGIGERAFMDCTDLQSVEGLERTTLRVIPAKCFYWCRSLKEISLPETLALIEAEAFYRCESLSRLLGLERTRIERIGHGAFELCFHLEEMHLPDTCTVLESYALRDTGIRALSLPQGFSALRFRSLPQKLPCLHIPDSLKETDEDTFSVQEIWCSQKTVEAVYRGLVRIPFHPDLKVRREDGTIAHIWGSPVYMTKERASCMGKVLATQDSQALLEAIPILAPNSGYPERNWLLFCLYDSWQGDLEEEVRTAVEKVIHSCAGPIVRQIYLAGNREGAIHFLSKGYVLPRSLDRLLALANDHQDALLAAAILKAKEERKKPKQTKKTNFSL